MTIRKGDEWGRVVPRPDDMVTVPDDASASGIVTEHRRAGRPLPPLGLRGGDLCRAVGGGDSTRLAGASVVAMPVDVLRVHLRRDGAEEVRWVVAHVVVRRGWWRGEITAAMNAQHLGRWDVAPRGHPNDGRFDMVQVSAAMSLRDRWKAWRRLPTGSHVPHPLITTRSGRSLELEVPPQASVRLDGVRLRGWTSVSIEVEADALTVCV